MMYVVSNPHLYRHSFIKSDELIIYISIEQVNTGRIHHLVIELYYNPSLLAQEKINPRDHTKYILVKIIEGFQACFLVTIGLH